MPIIFKPLVELTPEEWSRFKIYTIAKSGCWLWPKRTIKTGKGSGYGRLNLLGERLAHRVSYTLYKGEIPEGILVCHSCDTPLCINPAHLFLGTNTDNMQDAKNKGRTLIGEKNPQAKLTIDEVIAIREKYASGNYTQQALADEYGISRPNISMLASGVTWNHKTLGS